jgi:hypothetical protein
MFAARAAEAGAGSEGFWRTVPHQGPNTLYLFLRLWGRPVEYGKVRESLGAKGPYASFLHLRDTAKEFALPCTIYRCAPAELAQGPLPAVTLMDLHPDLGGTYVLVVGYDGPSWQFIDGTTGVLLMLSEDEFRRGWSGVVLAPQEGWPGWAVSLTAGLSILALYAGFRGLTRRRPAVDVPSFREGTAARPG